MNQPFINGSQVPAILAKVKAVDGPEPGEQAYIDRYGMTYEEAGIWARYVTQFWTGAEADYKLNGESETLRERIQLLFLFSDVQLFWDVAGAPQINDADFGKYVERVRALPNPEIVEKYGQTLERLKAEQSVED